MEGVPPEAAPEKVVAVGRWIPSPILFWCSGPEKKGNWECFRKVVPQSNDSSLDQELSHSLRKVRINKTSLELVTYHQSIGFNDR